MELQASGCDELLDSARTAASDDTCRILAQALACVTPTARDRNERKGKIRKGARKGSREPK